MGLIGLLERGQTEFGCQVTDYLLELLYDFLKGGLQLLRHSPFHGCQLGKGTILLHTWQQSVTHYNQHARHVHTYESRHDPLSS